MKVKLLEVRDRATFLPVMATLTESENGGQSFLLRSVGFCGGDSVILTRLNGESPSTADPYYWNDRTMKAAHIYIIEHFKDINDGDVVDVEYILQETEKPKISERYEAFAGLNL